jgi:beta-fructofuranosidase
MTGLQKYSSMLIPLLLLSGCISQQVNTDKTLVSWVILDDSQTDGGSILTLQDGEHFDGILLSEEGDAWIAGSENDRHALSAYDYDSGSRIAPGIGKLEQIAIVYKDEEILIYRDAVLQSRQRSENINLLNSETNIVVFGASHFGGEGSISGAIEDARIYSEALSEKELKLLQANKPSRINPYAWWDFEGAEVLDRTGRFAHHNLGEWEDIEINKGKLILENHGLLIAARTYMPETPVWPENPPDNWPTFHLAHPGPGEAWPGDPNPAFYYQGRYHMHYIYNNPYGFMFAHVSSTDMVHWDWQPTVLGPPKTGHGMFSGTGFFTREGKPVMIYHGIGSGRNQIMYGLDESLDEWTDPEAILPRDDEGNPADINHWDPDCWLMDGSYYALSGGEDPDLMKSDDLKNWTYLGKLLHEDYPDELEFGRDEDISCANMFRIGNKWMLLCISHRLGCRYFLGDFKDEKYLPESHALMNWKTENAKLTDFAPEDETLTYFAPESLLTKDGRRVMWAWMTADVNPTGIQSLPRELYLPEDGVLRIKPLKELESLRYEKQRLENITVTRDDVYRLNGISGDAIEMIVRFQAPLPEEFGIMLHGDEKGEEGLSITAGARRNTLNIGSISPPFELKDGENLTLRIFIDKNIVEVFANDRQAVAFATKEIRENPNIRLFTRDSDLVVMEVNTWKLRSNYNR